MASTLLKSLGASKSLGLFGLGSRNLSGCFQLVFSRLNLVVRDLVGFVRQDFRSRLKSLGLGTFRGSLFTGPEERCAYRR